MIGRHEANAELPRAVILRSGGDPAITRTWRQPLAIRIFYLFPAAAIAYAGVMLLLHGLGITHGSRSQYFSDSATNVVVGIVALVGGVLGGLSVSFRTRLVLNPDDLHIVNAVTSKRIPRRSVSHLDDSRFGIVISYVSGTQERSVTATAAQGPTGIRLFRHDTRANSISKELSAILELDQSA